MRQGAQAGTESKALKAKLSLNWTGPFKMLAVDPAAAKSTPDGRSLTAELLHLDLHSNMPGADAPCLVSVAASLARTPTTAPTFLGSSSRD